MIFKLAHIADAASLSYKLPQKAFDSLCEFLQVLDNEYGKGRSVEQDDGGYVLLCTPGTKSEEISSHFNCCELTPEWVNRISPEPEYCAATFMPREDYSIVLIMTTADAPFDTSEIPSLSVQRTLRARKPSNLKGLRVLDVVLRL